MPKKINDKEKILSLDQALENFALWVPLTEAEVFEEAGEMRTARSRGKKRGLFIDLGTSFSPKEIYCLLKAKFGLPNGMQMYLKRKNDVDNYIHWSWELKYKDIRIHFNGMFFNTTMFVSHIQDHSDPLPITIKTLTELLERYSAEIQRTQESLESWIVFSNPYYSLSTLVEEFETKLFSEPKIHRFNGRTSDLSIIAEKSNANSKVFSDIFNNRLILKLLIPIWIESFINLIIFVLSNRQIRLQPEIFSNWKRSSWKKRLKGLSINCDGFSKNFDWPQATEKLTDIFTTRNRILHGGVSPESTGKKIFFDQRFIPLLDEKIYMDDFFHDLSLHALDGINLLKELEVARDFISYCLTEINPSYAKLLVRVMNEANPGWDTNRDIAGVIIPPVIVDGVLKF